MCNRHELPPLIEPDVPGIVSKRIKRKEPVLSTQDPLRLETEAIFKGVRNALLLSILLWALVWFLIWLSPLAFGLAKEFWHHSTQMLAMGDWSQQ